MNYVPLKTYTTYSLLKSPTKPAKLVKKAKEYGFSSLAITELGNLYSAIQFYDECKKKDIKPILGCEFYIKEGGSISLLCKNLDGWKSLLQIISEGNLEENYRKIDKK